MRTLVTILITLVCGCGPSSSTVLKVNVAGTGAGTIASSPPGVSCGSASCWSSQPAGTHLTLTATAATTSSFAGWSGDCVGAGNTATVEMSEARSCTATFDYVGVTHLPFPQMPGHGQSPLAKLQLVTVTFGDYPYRSFVESFGDFVVGSQWLAAVSKDFGPIPATHLAKVNLPASAASDNYAAIVTANLGNALPYPADATGLVYVFYAPKCTSGGGYHSTVDHNGKPVAYLVAHNCTDEKAAAAVASHELAEVLTNAYGAGEVFDTASLPWFGEVGDICNDAPWWIEGGFRFTAIWSNAAAAAGGSPCVPWPADKPYFNVSPASATSQTVAAGSSVDITLTGWATGVSPSWPLVVNPDNYAAQDFNAAPKLSASTIDDGGTVQLTLHVPAGTASGKSATVRVQSRRSDQVAGVSGFSSDWSLQIIAK